MGEMRMGREWERERGEREVIRALKEIVWMKYWVPSLRRRALGFLYAATFLIKML
jgi:hypothetical protein